VSNSPDILVRMPDDVYLGAILEKTDTGFEPKPQMQEFVALQQENTIVSTVKWEDEKNFHRIVVAPSEVLTLFFPKDVLATGIEVFRAPFPLRTLSEEEGKKYQQATTDDNLLDIGLGITGERVLIGPLDTLLDFVPESV
jgi:hypothetical protein